MSRAQIELLISARNDAQQAMDNLNRQVTAITGSAGQASSSMENMGKKVKDTGVASQATAVAVGMLIDKVAVGLVRGFNDTLQAANKLDAGLIGLSSVAKAFGGDADKAKDAAKSLAADGLLSVGDAATGLKNLLASGFSLDQATELMNRFKDAAAFGRQGSLSFGEAVRSATEGVKNGNSILVDNVGITKNLSQILVEAGFSAQDLSKASSDVNVRMALFNGILKEGAPQRGDVVRFLDTAAGKQAQFSAQVEIAQQKIGKALQPALASLLDVLQPVVEVVGKMAPILVPLASAAAAVVVPLAAMRVAAALGIPAFAGLIGEFVKATTILGGVRSWQDARAGISLLGEAAGLTKTKLGPLGTAASVAGAAFIGWQIGKVIDQMTGLSGVVERATVNLMGWSSAQAAAEQKQDVLQRATIATGKTVTDYGRALQIIADLEDIRRGKVDQSIAVQERAIKAELDLGRVTQEQANARMNALKADQAALDVAKNRVSMADAVATAEKKVRDEIKATGLTLPELTKALNSNEAGFKAWATVNHLSADTVKFVEDALKKQTDAQKKSEEETHKLSEAHQKLLDSLQQVSLVTRERVIGDLNDLRSQLRAATADGIPLSNAVTQLFPRLKDLAEQARLSGIKVQGLGFAFQFFNSVMNETRPAADTVIGSVQDGIDVLTHAGKAVNVVWSDAQLNALKAEAAMKSLGIKSQTELRQIAVAARQSWQDIVNAGNAKTPEAIAAYKKMVDAEKAASGEIPNQWKNEIYPGIVSTLKNLQTAVQGSFAQMLLGAKSFGDGFSDIWKSIKASVLNILNEILGAFINDFLKGLIGGMSGQSSAMGAAFAGFFKGASGTGTSSVLAGISGKTGTGLSGFGSTGGFDITSTAGGAAFGGSVGAAVGYGVGSKTGSYSKGIASGAASGAAAGAIGGPIGMGIGALVGGIAGYFGAKKANNNADQQIASVKAQLIDTYGSMEKVRAAAAQVGVNIDLAFNQKGVKALTTFNSVLKAFTDKMKDLDAATERYGLTWEDLTGDKRKAKLAEIAKALQDDTKNLTAAGYDYDKVLKKQSQSYSELYAQYLESGEKVPAALKKILDRLSEMGLLVDENGDKILTSNDQLADSYAELEDLKRQADQASTQEQKNELNKRADDLQQWIDDQLLKIKGYAEGFAAEVATGAGKAAGSLDAAFKDKRYTVVVDIDDSGAQTPHVISSHADASENQTTPNVPGAAKGVMASRASLVLFGEGGETEVGGPASFFEKVFKKIAGDDTGRESGQGVVVNFGPGSIQVMDATGLQEAVEQRIIPAITNALSGNKRAARTKVRAALGVS